MSSIEQISASPVLQPIRDRPVPRVVAVVPCFRAAETVCDLVRRTLPFVDHVYVVDDDCPGGSGDRLMAAGLGPGVTLLRNDENLGVGGAVKRGYREALRDGADIVVKLDADDQMEPAWIPLLTRGLLLGEVDYAKGNRLAPPYRMPRGVEKEKPGRPMPTARRIGNNLISFVHKGVTGYWNIVDPANGYTAIHREALERIDLPKIADCYFFETDMLFQLNLIDAVVQDVPLPARYADEQSNLRIRRVIKDFPRLAARRLIKRLWIKYFLQDFNVASLEMLLGVPLVLFGVTVGLYHWIEAMSSGVPSTAGTVMFAALPIIIGFQLLLSAVSYDVANRPTSPLCGRSPPRE